MKYLTTCKIKKADGSVCGQEFTANELPDQTEQTKQGRAFVEGLMKHVEKKHPEAYLEIQTRWLSFLGFLVLGCFDLQDPRVRSSSRPWKMWRTNRGKSRKPRSSARWYDL